MKKIFLIMTLIFVFALPEMAKANEIRQIDVEVEILNDGSGKVTQYWQATADEGTEFFIPMQHLKHMKLKDFKVSNEEKDFEKEEDWDVDNSFEEKAYKYGIVEKGDGLELCFGMSSYKDHTYKIEYTFENMVESFSDADGFNVRFINDEMDPAPEKINYKIYSKDVLFNDENTNIWAFGYYGNIKFVDGAIVGTNTSEFNSSNHVTVLAEFEKGLFNPVYKEEGSFQDLKKIAFKGSSYGEGDEEYESSQTNSMVEPFNFGVFFAIIGVIFAFVIGLVAITKNSLNSISNISKAKENLVSSKEIPLEGNVEAVYYILSKNNSEKYKFNYFTAYLVKWMLDKYIDENLHILNTPNFNKASLEYELWKIIFGENSILKYNYSTKKVEELFEKDHLKFDLLTAKALDSGYKYFLTKNYIDVTRKAFIFKEKNLNEIGIREAKKVFEYEKYANSKDFSSKNTNNSPEEVRQNIILMTLMNAKSETINELYNDLQINNDNGFIPYYLLYNNSRNFQKAASKGHSKGVNNSSSGSGGSSSFGGGGGFSGGGSGGGAR